MRSFENHACAFHVAFININQGEIRTTVEYLRNLLELDSFRANEVTTGWLETVLAKKTVKADKPGSRFFSYLPIVLTIVHQSDHELHWLV